MSRRSLARHLANKTLNGENVIKIDAPLERPIGYWELSLDHLKDKINMVIPQRLQNKVLPYIASVDKYVEIRRFRKLLQIEHFVSHVPN